MIGLKVLLVCDKGLDVLFKTKCFISDRKGNTLFEALEMVLFFTF